MAGGGLRAPARGRTGALRPHGSLAPGHDGDLVVNVEHRGNPPRVVARRVLDPLIGNRTGQRYDAVVNVDADVRVGRNFRVVVERVFHEVLDLGVVDLRPANGGESRHRRKRIGTVSIPRGSVTGPRPAVAAEAKVSTVAREATPTGRGPVRVAVRPGRSHAVAIVHHGLVLQCGGCGADALPIGIRDVPHGFPGALPGEIGRAHV